MGNAVVVGSICLVLGVAGVAAASSVGGAKPLHLVERGGGISVVDNAPKARHQYDFSAGDIVVVTRDLYSVSGVRAGTLRLVCIATTPTAQHCTGSAQLQKGSIEFAGDSGPTPVTTVAVVGGTGTYADAHGTSTSTDRKGAADVADEVIRFTR